MMMIDVTRLYDEIGDKKKSSPGQWLFKKETKELIDTFNFRWHKEDDKIYFMDESLATFYKCYLNPHEWIKVISPEIKEIEIIKEVEKPFNHESYYKELIKFEYSRTPDKIINSFKSVTRRDKTQLLSFFKVNSINEMFDLCNIEFIRHIFGNIFNNNISADKFLFDSNDLLLGISSEKEFIYLTSGFRIKITNNTETKYF